MDTEKILSALTETLGTTQLSERTLTAYIESHPIADGAEPSEEYLSSASTFLKSLEGQYNHDVAEGIKKAGTPPTKKNEPSPTPEADTPEGNDEKHQALLERIAALEKAQTERQNAEAQSALIEEVKAEMKKSNATDDYVLKQTFKGVTLDSSKSIADLTTEMLSKYDAEYKACRGDGAPPRQTNGGGGGSESRSDRFFSRIKKKEGWAQKNQTIN